MVQAAIVFFPVLAIRAAFAAYPADKMNMRAKTKRPKRPAKRAKRPIGLAKNKFKITKPFLKPLPNKLLDAFEGKS